MIAQISEIFKSIQGEGTYQGKEQVFVRFFGCNLACMFCDTKVNFYQEKTAQQVLETIESYDNYHAVSLTGGEPLLQADFLLNLCRELKRNNKVTYLETNGTLYTNLREVINYIDIVSMDFKLPSSTGSAPRWAEHREFLSIASSKDVFIKAVIGRNTVVEDILQSIKLMKEVYPRVRFVLQPEHPHEGILSEKLRYFQSICRTEDIDAVIMSQLHKKMGVR